MIDKATIFVTPDCTVCKEVRSFLETKSFPLTIVDASSEEGISLVRKHDIFVVPTVWIYTSSGKHIARDIADIKKFL